MDAFTARYFNPVFTAFAAGLVAAGKKNPAPGRWRLTVARNPLTVSNLPDDFGVIGKASRLVLRVDQTIVDAHVKNTAAALDELRINAKRFIQRSR